MQRLLYFEKIHPDAKVPIKAHQDDACWDLFSVEDKIIYPNCTETIRTGLIFEILVGEKLHIYSKSGLAAKYSIAVLNAPGVIDAGYTGEIQVILHNYHRDQAFQVIKGSKIAQFSREIVLDDGLVENVVCINSERGVKGFGSSGL